MMVLMMMMGRRRRRRRRRRRINVVECTLYLGICALLYLEAAMNVSY